MIRSSVMTVDQSDFGHMQICLTGFLPQEDPACQNARLTAHTYVNDGDMTLFLRCLASPGAESDPTCTD